VLLTEADHQLVTDLVSFLLPLATMTEEHLKKSGVSKDLLEPMSVRFVMDGSGECTLEKTPTL
jgi:hypothetical protein